ncbi:MAG: transposase [Balneolaceae bacterium]|nr:transposase [Balneolaceae bacterium]
MSKKKTFTEEEKAAIAKQAASGGDETIKESAEKHGVSIEQIKLWIRESNAADVDYAEDEVSLEATDDFEISVTYGATFDKLNYRRLTFWSAFGTITIVLFIVAIIYIHDYTQSSVSQDRAEQSLFYNIEEIQQRDRAQLESFGVVDPEEGIYRIPIDSAITIIATD